MKMNVIVNYAKKKGASYPRSGRLLFHSLRPASESADEALDVSRVHAQRATCVGQIGSGSLRTGYTGSSIAISLYSRIVLVRPKRQGGRCLAAGAARAWPWAVAVRGWR